MGARGPVPKRSDQRRRVNVPEGPPPKAGRGSGKVEWAAYAVSVGVEVPMGASRDEIVRLVADRERAREWHPLASEWFESLRPSGQSEFYEPSDWATARVLAEVLSRALSAGKLNASLVERWQAGATELLTTEGARRRMRVELEALELEPDEAVAILDDYRHRPSG